MALQPSPGSRTPPLHWTAIHIEKDQIAIRLKLDEDAHELFLKKSGLSGAEVSDGPQGRHGAAAGRPRNSPLTMDAHLRLLSSRFKMAILL